MVKENKKVLYDSNYVKCGKDTVLVPPYIEAHMDKFERNIQESIKKTVPKSIIDSTTVKTYYPSMKQFLEHTKYTYADDYKDVKPIIDNSKYYTTNGYTVYVPVEYYGIPTNK